MDTDVKNSPDEQTPAIEFDEQTPAIEFENLTRKFGEFTAVDSINLKIPAGSFFGFLGQNGAGKSTTINMLIGLLKPTKGRILVHGKDIEKHSLEVKKILGIVPEHINLYERLKGREYLEFSGIMYGLSHDQSVDRTKEVLDLLEVNGEKYIADLSMGMKKKVSLGAALLHQPNILILDEPFTSVDAISARKIKDILMRMIKSGVTMFMTSHILEIIEKLCDHLAIIHNGKILLNGKTMELLEGTGENGRLSLEDIFVDLIGIDKTGGELSWIK